MKTIKYFFVGIAIGLLAFAGVSYAGRTSVNGTDVTSGYSTSTIGVARISAQAGQLYSMAVTSTSSYIAIGLYDNASTTAPYSGTRIATTTFAANSAPTTLFFDVPFSNGLSIVTTGSAASIVISYR